MSEEIWKEQLFLFIISNGLFWFIYVIGIAGRSGLGLTLAGLTFALTYITMSLDIFSKEKVAVEKDPTMIGSARILNVGVVKQPGVKPGYEKPPERVNFFAGVISYCFGMVLISVLVNYFLITNVTPAIRGFISSVIISLIS